MRRQSRYTDTRQARSIDRLTRRFGKYGLVAGVAKRAQDLKERIDSKLEPGGGGLINRAIREIASGEVRVIAPKPEEESD
jgi:DNA-directed RNA polymerase subunit K/omega